MASAAYTSLLTSPQKTGLRKTAAFQTLVIGSWPGFSSAWRESVGVEPEFAKEMPPGGREDRMIAGQKKLAPAEQEEQTIVRSPKEGLAMMGRRFSASPVEYLEWYLIQKPALFWGWGIQIGQGEIYVNPIMNSPLETVPLLHALESLVSTARIPFLRTRAFIAGFWRDQAVPLHYLAYSERP